jgi:hypothetical protein
VSVLFRQPAASRATRRRRALRAEIHRHNAVAGAKDGSVPNGITFSAADVLRLPPLTADVNQRLKGTPVVLDLAGHPASRAAGGPASADVGNRGNRLPLLKLHFFAFALAAGAIPAPGHANRAVTTIRGMSVRFMLTKYRDTGQSA